MILNNVADELCLSELSSYMGDKLLSTYFTLFAIAWVNPKFLLHIP